MFFSLMSDDTSLSFAMIKSEVVVEWCLPAVEKNCVPSSFFVMKLLWCSLFWRILQ